MIDQTDKKTVDLLPPVKRGRGRPSTGKAMTPAQKQKAYRERLKNGNGNVTEYNNGNGAENISNPLSYDARENNRLRALYEEMLAGMAVRDVKIDQLLAEIADWRDKYYQRDTDYRCDLKAVIDEKNRKISAIKGVATKAQNDRATLADRVESLENQLARLNNGNVTKKGVIK